MRQIGICNCSTSGRLSAVDRLRLRLTMPVDDSVLARGCHTPSLALCNAAYRRQLCSASNPPVHFGKAPVVDRSRYARSCVVGPGGNVSATLIRAAARTSFRCPCTPLTTKVLDVLTAWQPALHVLGRLRLWRLRPSHATPSAQLVSVWSNSDSHRHRRIQNILAAAFQ